MMPRPLDVGTGCAVVMFNEKRDFFMLRRSSPHGFGTWCVPGGWMEFGESFETAGAREIAEETGAKIENIRVIGVTNNIKQDDHIHTVSVVMAAMLAKDSDVPHNAEPDKASEAAWVALESWNNLPAPTFTEYSRFIPRVALERYLSEVHND